MPMPKLGIRERWRKIKSLPQFRNILTFMAFVAVAILFWVVLSLNDSVTHTFRVRVVIKNVPDTVTFITEPPQDMNLTLRDKGTNILRSGIIKHPVVNFNFGDYARDGIMRITKSDLMAGFKESFGSGMQVISMSLDSLRIYYSDSPGRRVPVVVRVKVTASSGNIIAGAPMPLDRSVRIFSYGNETDTINRVETELLVKNDLKHTETFDVRIKPIPKVRIVPPIVKVKVPVEPLVLKEGYAQIETRNVPEGVSMLLFPNRVPVSYYVPMSIYSEKEPDMVVYADYIDTKNPVGNKVPVRLGTVARDMVNPVLKMDSVEYTLLRR